MTLADIVVIDAELNPNLVLFGDEEDFGFLATEELDERTRDEIDLVTIELPVFHLRF
jgi:hypothetical protein